MCGVFGVISEDFDIAEDDRIGLWSLQHRGHDSAGIVIYQENNSYWQRRKLGMVDFVFYDAPLRVKGKSGIGHVRYSTTGENTLQNVQPVRGLFSGSFFWLAHNGNLVRTEKLREELLQRGYVFEGSTDTELIAALIFFSHKEKFEDALAEALARVEGTYALVTLYKNMVIGVRDRTGNRSLVYGEGRGLRLFASESAACDVLNVRCIREVYPGEMIILQSGAADITSHVITDSLENNLKFQKPCLFEYIYLSRPDSVLTGRRMRITRKLMGKYLWKEAPVEADIVVPIPDSGNDVGRGMAEESGLPIEEAFFRFHYVGRSFIQSTPELRNKTLRIKLNVIPDLVAGKRVVTADDSRVRGTVSKRTTRMLFEAGAREVHERFGSPMLLHKCCYGVVMDDLIAQRHKGDIEKIRKEIGATSSYHLSIENVKRAIIESGVGELREDNFCDACFSGNYHIPIK